MPNNVPTYLAIDLGAESGRVILGTLRDGQLQTREVHRFANEPVNYGGSLHWDVVRLWLEIQRALGMVGDRKLDGIAVDAWGVDYALLGESGELLGNPYHYRDKRTTGMLEKVFRKVPEADIYQATGIQFMPINTLYQLFAAQERTPDLLALSHHLLTIPDLFNYWLTGRTVCEWTNASTTQMADPRTGNWARPMLGRLGLPTHMLTEIVNPGTLVGTVLPSSAYHLAGTPVVAPASHDTGSAVAAFEARHDTAFLSSGTWSLLGIELDVPIINDLARALNFTNEAGVCGTTRFLKNVMGLWMVQGCRKSLASRGDSQPYDALVAAASEARPFETLLDPDDPRFLNPACMLTAIDSFCDDTSQPRPCNPAAYIRAVLESLALRYRVVMDDLERLTNLRIRNVRVVGGGSRNALLNQFTADATGRTAMTGPVEATALGNLAMQILATGVASSLRECREIVARTHESRVFEPSGSSVWDRQFERFQEYARGTHCLKH